MTTDSTPSERAMELADSLYANFFSKKQTAEESLAEIISIAGYVDRSLAVEREECAEIADKWAQSHSCDSHDDNPCCHVRTGVGISGAIRNQKEGNSNE